MGAWNASFSSKLLRRAKAPENLLWTHSAILFLHLVDLCGHAFRVTVEYCISMMCLNKHFHKKSKKNIQSRRTANFF